MLCIVADEYRPRVSVFILFVWLFILVRLLGAARPRIAKGG